jgi:hypothetical protein
MYLSKANPPKALEAYIAHPTNKKVTRYINLEAVDITAIILYYAMAYKIIRSDIVKPWFDAYGYIKHVSRHNRGESTTSHILLEYETRRNRVDPKMWKMVKDAYRRVHHDTAMAMMNNYNVIQEFKTTEKNIASKSIHHLANSIPESHSFESSLYYYPALYFKEWVALFDMYEDSYVVNEIS